MLNVPQILLLLTMAAVAYHSQTPLPLEPIKCQEQFCNLIHVDTPKNTLLKDQSMGQGLGYPRRTGFKTVYDKVKTDYQREQLASPGVRLVAHTVA